jgi:hypothetical protein
MVKLLSCVGVNKRISHQREHSVSLGLLSTPETVLLQLKHDTHLVSSVKLVNSYYRIPLRGLGSTRMGGREGTEAASTKLAALC